MTDETPCPGDSRLDGVVRVLALTARFPPPWPGRVPVTSLPAVSEIQTVRLPRLRRPDSYSRQFLTRIGLLHILPLSAFENAHGEPRIREYRTIVTEIASCAPRQPFARSSHSGPSANGVQVPSIIGAVYVRLSIDRGSLRSQILPACPSMSARRSWGTAGSPSSNTLARGTGWPVLRKKSLRC